MMPLSTRGVLGHFYEPADALAAAVRSATPAGSTSTS